MFIHANTTMPRQISISNEIKRLTNAEPNCPLVPHLPVFNKKEVSVESFFNVIRGQQKTIKYCLSQCQSLDSTQEPLLHVLNEPFDQVVVRLEVLIESPDQVNVLVTFVEANPTVVVVLVTIVDPKLSESLVFLKTVS